MASGFGIVEITGLTKLTWELYSQCRLVSQKNAPDEFQNLVTGLGSLQGTLRALGDDVHSNIFFFAKMNDARKRTLEQCLEVCSTTLQQLKEILAQYRSWGIGDGSQFWQRVPWVTQCSQIEEIRSTIMLQTYNLTICMSDIEDDSLTHSERSTLQTMDEDELAVLPAELPAGPDVELKPSPLSPRNAFSGDYEKGSRAEFRETPISISGPHAPRFSASGPRDISISSDSVTSGSDASLYSGTAPTSPRSLNTTRSVTSSMMNAFCVHPGERCDIPDGPFDGRTVDVGVWGSTFEKQSMARPSQSSNTEIQRNVMDAVTNAMQELRQVQLSDQLSPPIRYEVPDKLHKPDREVLVRFENSANGELKIRNLDTQDWLRIATWWLLKARATLINCNRHVFVSARGSTSPSTDSKTTSHQAYADLLKASYILYDVVLKDEDSSALLTDENRKSVVELSEGINEELSQYTSIDIPETSDLCSQNLEIWEPLQPEEAAEKGNGFSFRRENARWITVDKDDAGEEDERVLFRTFVNAGIGSKKFRMRTKGAPYMLLLITKYGESEPKVIMCNQTGKLCLQRDFLPNDLPPLIALSNQAMTGFPGVRISEPFPFKFNNTSVSISFQFETDLSQFVKIPKSYFEAVRQREPIDSNKFNESIIFKTSVETFEQLKTPHMKSMNPSIIWKSCEIRILERSYGDVWRSTRRLVISSSAAEQNPGCMEFFMPLSRVQVCREDVSRQVLLRWSDTCQERLDKTDGSYNTLYSYVYDADTPNIGVGLRFRTQQSAEDFEKAILYMNFPTDFAWSQPSSSGCIYDVVDTGKEHKKYKAVALFQTKFSWRYSEFYFVYRDTDYAYEHASLTVRFPRISYADYISTHVDRLYHADSPVSFSHCERKTGKIVIEFDNQPVSRSFLSALSPFYDLLFSRHALSISTKHKSLFGSKKSSKGGAEVQVWRRGNSIQLAARWDGSVQDNWLTASVSSTSSDSSKESTRVNFPRLPFFRGVSLDMTNIMARGPRSTTDGQREGPISILFQNTRDRQEFLDALKGNHFASFV
ncbi:hypothetical protein N7510_006479 [Penicillium lagena]|uniref:uncharacterized protein n=1 Tax=Penicillium lagena TaxID=94218 RepID=UPI002541C91B|nr:uncharacterized protein N7510_006479 [Penicillium lagena]KAJ5613285.1 hypothetical protein N7510_006479 [Penicillium lagena]